jgi:HEAT repeat protein
LTLAEAAAEAATLAERGAERELAELRARWADELEACARSADFRARAVAYRAVGQMRFRQKVELLRRGLEDDSPACRGAALLSLELLSRDQPGTVNAVRSRLHQLADADPNAAVRRIAVMCLKNGSPQPDTIRLLTGLAEDDGQEGELRAAAARVADTLRRRAGPRRR